MAEKQPEVSIIAFYTLLALTEEIGANKIAQKISEISNGRIVIKTGTLHSLLIRLESFEWVIETGQINGKTRMYKITELGRSILLDQHDQMLRAVLDSSCVISDLLKKTPV